MHKFYDEVSKITPNLYLTNGYSIHASGLSKLGINLVINVTKDLDFQTKNSEGAIINARVPVDDNVQANLLPYFQPICDLIAANEEENNGSTLIHCMQGRSRSASLVIAYLLWKDGCSDASGGSLSGGSCVYKYKLYETLDAVKKIRQIVQPNPAFMAQLVKWEDSLRTNAGGKMKNKQEKDYSVANEFKDLDTKVVSAIREILSITLQIRSPMPSDGIELEF